MRILNTLELENLKNIFEPYGYFDKICYKLREDAPKEAVEAYEKYLDLSRKLYIKNAK